MPPGASSANTPLAINARRASQSPIGHLSAIRPKAPRFSNTGFPVDDDDARALAPGLTPMMLARPQVGIIGAAHHFGTRLASEKAYYHVTTISSPLHFSSYFLVIRLAMAGASPCRHLAARSKGRRRRSTAYARASSLGRFDKRQDKRMREPITGQVPFRDENAARRATRRIFAHAPGYFAELFGRRRHTPTSL